MELPQELSTGNPVHIQTIYQAIETSTQSPLEEVRKPAEELLKACEDLPGYTSVLIAIVGTHAASTDARAGAVILLKNVVRVRWKSRGGRGHVVGEGEKAALRGYLLSSSALEEPHHRVASQLAVLAAKIARVDWPRQWSELFPSLVPGLLEVKGLRRQRALCYTNEVLKELSTKRVGLDRAAFVRTSGDLFPVMCQAWNTQWALLESSLVALGSGNFTLAQIGPDAGDMFALATVGVKILRRLLEFGIPGLEHPQIECFFQGLLQRMQGISATLERLQAQMTAHGIVPGGLAGSGDGGGVLSEVQELWERMAAISVDAQKDHPIGFRRYLRAYLPFFDEQLAAARHGREEEQKHGSHGSATGGPESLVAYPHGPFCIQCMSFLSNVIGCNSYREDVLANALGLSATREATSGSTTSVSAASPSSGVILSVRASGRLITAKGDAVITADAAREISSTVKEFFTTDRANALFNTLSERFLRLTPAEMEEWHDGAEQYFLLQDSLEARESVRVSAQHLLMTLLECREGGISDAVASTIASMLSMRLEEQIDACRHSTLSQEVLAYDALYLSAGLGAYSLKRLFDFQAWFSAFLQPGLEALVSQLRARQNANQDGEDLLPLVLLRRIMWLFGCWAEQIPDVLRPRLVKGIASVMQAPQADLVTRLSAFEALRALLALWDLDAEKCLGPALEWLLTAIYQLFADLEEMENRQQLLTGLSELLERSGHLLVPHYPLTVTGITNAWETTASQTPLRSPCLQVMTHVLDALGTAGVAEVQVERIALVMVDVATKVDTDESVYLMEAGLELLLALLRNAKDYTEGVHRLFPRIPEMLEGDFDNLKQGMLITEAYTLIGRSLFLQAHGSLVCGCFNRLIGQVKPKGTAFVTRALESILRSFPSDGSRMLAEAGVVAQIMDACARALADDPDREPDLVIVQYLSIVCRVILGAPEVFRQVLQQTALAALNTPGAGVASSCAEADKMLAGLVGQMSTLFDSAGYGEAGIWRRRLWALALLSLLPSANEGVVRNLDQVVNICVDVLMEATGDGEKRLKETLNGSLADYGKESGSDGQASSLRSRAEGVMRTDVAITTDLRSVVRANMDALHSGLGEVRWQAAMDTVEPVVLAQLHRMVA